MYYWTCPRCGANLDTGERCDCVEGGISEGQAIPHRRESSHWVTAIRRGSCRNVGMTERNASMR